MMSDKLVTKCEKCEHPALLHNPKSGKHECKVSGCDCQWFKLPKE